MIILRPSEIDELVLFDELDRQVHARRFVDQIGMDGHRKNYDDSNSTYLTIETASDGTSGYLLLVVEAVTASVECRRIVIDQDRRGIGQAVIAEMERYCQRTLDARRVWLDVYEDNAIGIHVYTKLGYERFDEKVVNGRTLYFHEKSL